MTCEEINGLLSVYADGELDLLRSLEIEAHLPACPACSAALERARTLGVRLANPGLYHHSPPSLRERVRASLPRTGRKPGRLAALPWRRVGVAIAAAAVVVVAVWGALRWVSGSSDRERLARAVVAHHISSLMLAEPRLDIADSDEHQVKPWFSDKVDFVPEVKQLSKQGFPLLGGRLEYLDERRAAALVYRRHKHIINVFIYRTSGKDAPPEVLEQQGYHLIHWIDNERAFWVVSDLNAKELGQFAQMVRE